MKRIILILCAISLLLITGCANNPMPTSVPLPTTEPIVFNGTEQVLAVRVNEGNKWPPLAPAYIQIGKVKAGYIIDTWVDNGIVIFGDNIIEYKRGDDFSLFVVNCTGETQTYDITYLEARKDVVFDSTSENPLNDGKGYKNAPIIARSWVSLPTEITVHDGCVMNIPIKIEIPKYAEVPDTWAFRIGVSYTTNNLLNYQSSAYILISNS